MTDRVIVSASDLPGLCRVAKAARALSGDGRVEAVALTDGEAVLAPRASSLHEVSAAVGGLADVVLAYPVGGHLRGDLWAAALQDAAVREDFMAVLLADAPPAREAAGRLAVVLDAPCASMCETVAVASEGGLTVQRAIYGGVARGTLTLDHTPAICLFAAGPSESYVEGGLASVEQRSAPLSSYDVALVSEEPVERTVDLVGARRVVSVGRGFSSLEDVALVEPLVAALDAELGCSRPVAEDFKWLPKERVVGLTGSSVSADLYVALGISGQVQHLAGVKGARVIAAVNSDAKAPIVRNADYVVVGDLHKVVPELVAALGGAT